MLKRIMMIPISLAAAGGLPFLALNRDLATRFEAALDELTVPSQEEAAGETVEIPSPFGNDSPFRLASDANDGTGTGSGTTRSNSSSSGAYGGGSGSSGTGGSGTSRSGSGTSGYGTSGTGTGGTRTGGSGAGGSGAGGTSTYGSSSTGGSRTSGTAGSGTSGNGSSGSAGSTGSGSGSASGSSGVGGTRTSNGVTTYGSGAAAAAGGTSSGSGTTGSTSSAGRSASGSTTAGGGTTGSSTAGTGFSAPPLSAGQELRNPTPGLGLGEGRGGGDWPTTPVLGNDYREVFRFDVTPNWVKASWPRVSTGWTEDQLEGYRVPLVTGTRVNDLTGSLTFFFDAEHRVQRLRFVGNTGDASRLVELVTRYFDMELEPTRLAGLYTHRYLGKPVSVLRIAHDSVLRADRPNLQLSIVLEINNPRGSYKLSDAVGELLATDPPISSR